MLPNVDSVPSRVLTQTTVFYLTVTYSDAAGTAYPVTIEQTVTVMVQPAITSFAGTVSFTSQGPQLALSW